MKVKVRHLTDELNEPPNKNCTMMKPEDFKKGDIIYIHRYRHKKSMLKKTICKVIKISGSHVLIFNFSNGRRQHLYFGSETKTAIKILRDDNIITFCKVFPHLITSIFRYQYDKFGFYKNS